MHIASTKRRLWQCMHWGATGNRGLVTKMLRRKMIKKTYEQRFLCLGWDGTNTWKYTERYQSITNGMTTETKRLKSKRNESKLKCSSLIFVADRTQSTRICAFKKKSLYISFSRLKHNPWVFKLKLVERFQNLVPPRAEWTLAQR